MNPSARIKQIPEDFIVEEITPDGEILEQNKKYKFQKNSKGKFLHCVLIKKSTDTIEAIIQIAKALKIDNRRITFAGTKDRHAITSQRISMMELGTERIKDIKLENVQVIPLYYASNKAFLGDLKGNRFTITIRNISLTKEQLADQLNNTISKLKGKFPNYFGEQRFGTGKKATTHLIGKAVIEEDYSKAFELYNGLKLNQDDAISALKQIPLPLRKMFIHAYQSHLFNILLERMLVDGLKPDKIPLIGFDYNSMTSKDYDSYVSQLMKEEKLDIKKFRIAKFPELLSKTELRSAFQTFDDFGILKIEKDELANGKLKCILQFKLPKGTYATVFLKELFNIQQG